MSRDDDEMNVEVEVQVEMDARTMPLLPLILAGDGAAGGSCAAHRIHHPHRAECAARTASGSTRARRGRAAGPRRTWRPGPRPSRAHARTRAPRTRPAAGARGRSHEATGQARAREARLRRVWPVAHSRLEVHSH